MRVDGDKVQRRGPCAEEARAKYKREGSRKLAGDNRLPYGECAVEAAMRHEEHKSADTT